MLYLAFAIDSSGMDCEPKDACLTFKLDGVDELETS